MVIGSLSLAACAEEEAGPQFANDPMPTRSMTEAGQPGSPAPLPTSSAVSTPVIATPASVTDLLSTRGAPTRVYTVSGNTLWAVTSDGIAGPIFQAPEATQIVAIDAAPSGQEVAALVRTTSGSQPTEEVVILTSAGETVARIGDFGTFLATPQPADRLFQADAIDWSPQGDRALVSFQDGAIVALPLAGARAPIERVGSINDGVIVSPAWSPTGESLAFISATDAERTRTLRLLDVSDGHVDDVVFPPAGRFVVDFAWLPDGKALLFTEGGELGGAVGGIDLWKIDTTGEQRELVVSAGTVAPVARITNIQPSPDGRSVAYSVLVPGSDGPLVDSVWIRDLESRLGFKISMPEVNTIDAIWWTDQGLVIAVTTRAADEKRDASELLLQVRRDGSVGVLWAAPVPTGTPVSSPPAATPTG